MKIPVVILSLRPLRFSASSALKKACLATLTLTVAAAAQAADLEVQTKDGQTFVGEYLGKENNVVKIKTNYGLVSVPADDITQTRAVESVATPDRKTAVSQPASVEQPAPEPGTFPLPKPLNIVSMVAARAGPPPEPNKHERQELHRLVRIFGESKLRGKIIRNLRNYGRMAEPFITAAYTGPFDLSRRVALMEALAVSDSPYNAGILAEVHEKVEGSMHITAEAPPRMPPDYLSMRDRRFPQSRNAALFAAANDLLNLESYSSIAGGPFNTLLLLQIYTARYSGEPDALLNDSSRDRNRLTSAASNINRASAGWTRADRILAIEQTLPLLFANRVELRTMSQDLLKKLLPSKHPKWEATQAEWVEWWAEAKGKI